MLRQSGRSRSSATGSITAPDRICAPTSEPFSRTTTEISFSRLGGELLQPDRGGQPRGPGADDDDVELHDLAFGGFWRGGFAQTRLQIAAFRFFVIPAKAGIRA